MRKGISNFCVTIWIFKHIPLLLPLFKNPHGQYHAKKINKNGVLQLISQEERTQLRNKEIVIRKFYELLRKCFVEPKKRKPTKPTKAAKVKRLETKKKTAEIKKLRKFIENIKFYSFRQSAK